MNIQMFGRLKKEHWNEILGALIVVLAVWMLISLIGYGGNVGDRLKSALEYWVGYMSFLLVLVIGYWGLNLFMGIRRGILSGLLGPICLFISGLVWLSPVHADTRRSAGLLGEGLNSILVRFFGIPGLILAGLVFLILGVVLSTELTFKDIFRIVHVERKKPSADKRKKPAKETVEEPTKPPRPAVIISDSSGGEAKDIAYLRHPSVTSPYVLPPLSLLDKSMPEDEELTRDVLQETARILERSFKDFNISARVLRVNRGPVITRYEVEPGPGVKVNKFVNLSDDLALVLRATRVRVVAPVPGAGVIGIEVPNEKIMRVGLREVLESQEFRNTKSKLALPLGKDISGTPVVADLAEMPHLLIAGTTGSGKSVFINSIISSMLFRMTPNELRLLMVDTKRVELKAYEGIPHLVAPVVTDNMKAPAYLRWALREVERRYKKLADVGARNIESYNQYMEDHPDAVEKTMEEDRLVHGKLPYILIVIDELADLMLSASSEVESAITRLAQIGRAAGVHMLVATQRPSVDVITGLIKANFPSRLSFRVASKVDSRTILDMNGAENLLGKGDMLFLDINSAKPIRIQGCYVSEAEIERLVDFIRQHAPYDRVTGDMLEDEESEDDGDDELYDLAVRLVLKHRTASTSFLQRKLNVSYERAVQLLQDMEAEGVVGPDTGKGSREILISKGQTNKSAS